MTEAHPTHVAVIGAGPAGSVAAIRLAQLGHRVTVFEKATFPRHKVCGECLSATGIAVLERLSVADAVRQRCQPINLLRARAVSATGDAVEVRLPQRMWGLTRHTMDACLAELAVDAGARIRFGVSAAIRSMSVPLVRHDGDGHATGIVVDAGDEAGPTAADVIVLSDGSGRRLARIEPTGDFGVKAHFRGVDAAPDTIELVALSAGYAGLAPVNDGLWNAAWSVPAGSLKRFGGDIQALFEFEISRSPTLRRRFRRSTRVGEWLACPLPRYAVRRDWPIGVIPIGNAAAALEPVGGEGMGLAMRSAELAAEAIDAAARSSQPLNVTRLRGQFDQLWRKRRTACRMGAIALSHPFFGPLTVGVAERASSLTRLGLALVGK